MRKDVVRKINRYFRSLGKEEALKLSGVLKDEIGRLNIRYDNDDGSSRDIRLVLRPWLIKPGELKFFHRLIYAFKGAHHKLFELYLKDKEVQDVMPLREEEKQWFAMINRPKPQKHQVVFGRWDANVAFDERDAIRDVKFLETNTVGIGGVHYIPAVSEAAKKILSLSFEKEIRPQRLGFQPDVRRLLAEEAKSHAKSIGRKRLNVAFLENREFLGGTVEMPELTRYFQALGINAILADPRDLRLRGKEIYFKDTNIDIIYRDAELQELIDIEKKGHNMAVLKQAFINNQVISSISGELDHKSGFEIFTSPRFSRFFTPAERAIFKKYLPWTRILKERKTSGPRNSIVDLITHARKNKDKLVIKPNRAYGGKDVIIGRISGKKQWDSFIQKAAAHPGDYVVQDLVNIREEAFPFFNDKKIEFDKFYSVSGFVVTRRAIAVLGRFSKEMVVNVARKGGIIPALQLLG